MDYMHEWTDDELEATINRIFDAYNQAAKELQDRYRQFMKEFVPEYNKNRAKYKRGEISRKEWKAWARENLITKRWFEDMVATLADDAANVDAIASRIINGNLASVYAENYNWGYYEIEQLTGISRSYALYDKDTVERLLGENPQLLPNQFDFGKDLSWNQARFNSAITQGVLQGESVQRTVNRLVGVLGMDYSAAVRNARTAYTAAENGGRQRSYERARSMGINIRKRWVATLDGRTRDSHRDIDGEIVELNGVYSNKLRFPGDPEGSAAEVYNCRCTEIAVIEGIDMSDAKRRSKLNGESYEEWKKGKNG